MKAIVLFISNRNKAIKIIIDPVIKSSSGFDFWQEETNKTDLFETLSNSFLITPNYLEATQLMPADDAKDAAQRLAQYCAVLLKGGHNAEETGIDYLYTKNAVEKLLPHSKIITPKHGSGCVLSASITANIALGFEIITACEKAKRYIEQFLSSNNSLLGYHYV